MSAMWKVITDFLAAHGTSATILGTLIFAKFVGKLPVPTSASNWFYQFVFEVLNAISINMHLGKQPVVVTPAPPVYLPPTPPTAPAAPPC
jgi:hypothetical protein